MRNQLALVVDAECSDYPTGHFLESLPGVCERMSKRCRHVPPQKVTTPQVYSRDSKTSLPILNWERRDAQTCVNSVIGCEIDTLHFPRFIGRLKEHQVRAWMCSKQRSWIRKALNKLHMEPRGKKQLHLSNADYRSKVFPKQKYCR